MVTPYQEKVNQLKVKERIACDEEDYPFSEALFSDTREWEDFHGESWGEYVMRQIG